MHTIKIDVLNPNSIDRAIKEIEKYEVSVKEALRVSIAKLAGIGIPVLQARLMGYAALAHNPDEAEGIHVTVQNIENGMIIRAYGEKIAFIEFGTGDMTHTSHEGASRMPFPVAAGSWSQTVGKKHYPPDWWYNGRHYTGTMAADAFPEATAVMKAKAAEIVKETFETWL